MKLLISDEEFNTLKSRADVPLECEVCGTTFYAPKYRVKTAQAGNGRTKLICCSKACAGQKHKKTQIITCTQCGKTVERQASQMQKATTYFCSNSCSAIYNNLHKKRGATQRSKAEGYLISLLRADFPDLDIQENVRNSEPSKHEIDILIPSLRLAIEINGPIHYFPLYGEAQLQKIQNADIQKQNEIITAGYALIVVDMGHIKHFNRARAFLDKHYPTHIKPILQERLGQS